MRPLTFGIACGVLALVACGLLFARALPLTARPAPPGAPSGGPGLLLGSLAVPALAGPPGAARPATYRPELRRYPYLTDVVGPYATVNWATDRSSPTGSVSWGQAGVESCTAHSAPAIRSTIIISTVIAYQWTAPLTLTTGTAYCYRVYLGGLDLLGTDPSPQFRTQIPAGDPAPFSFAVFGDWGAVYTNGTNLDQANVMARLANSGAAFAVSVGDNAYPSGSQGNYGDLYQVGLNLSGVFGPAFWTVPGARMPIFPAIGNHGFARADTYHPHLLNWPQDRAVATSGGRYRRETYCCVNGTMSEDYPSTWYAFDAGSARFYVLEAAWDDGNPGLADSYANDYATHWTPTSDEYLWLEQDLSTHPTPLKFAFFHYPLYSDQSVDHSDTFLQGAASLEGLLSRYGVNIAFTGHAHIYQRNLKPSPDSLISYVTGGGGADLEPIGALGCTPVDAYGLGWSDTANRGSACGSAPVPTSVTQIFHFLLVSINGPLVTVAPTDELGRTFDVQTYTFLPPTATPTPTPGGPSATPVHTHTPVVTPTSTACALQFTDVDASNPFYPFIRCLACRGIVSGYADGTFRWGADVTRGQLAKIIANAAGLTDPIPSDQQTFSDVPATNPFWVFIERLYEVGAISGYQCGGPGEPCDPQQRPYFRFGANATRGQIAKIVANAANLPDPVPTTRQTFEDVPSSNVFWYWIEQLAGRGVISGYGCGGPGEPCNPPGNRPYFRWGVNTTRGQLAKIAANTFFPNCQTPARR